ncbi:hypothetical protein ACIOD2_32440 [Amycolatopsis sp. NPDC088138]|uniref:Gp37-like protein n=1 Tax=Amycolatopsis sp. NPDC088138 TaxID=3363938 RepID=UPI00382EBC91
MTFEWKVYARDPNYQRQGEIDDYSDLECTPTYNGVGTWKLTLDSRAPTARFMTKPGWGIILTRNDSTIFSGIRTDTRRTRDARGDQIEISGFSDDIWLQDRLVSPSPTESSPPYALQASDVRAGLASTVIVGYVNANLGPGAVATRRKANFTLAADPAIGYGVRGEARWDADLLAFIQPLAQTGAVGFRVVQVGAGLEFQVYAPTDRSATVKFSVEIGNLAGFEYASSRPKANYVYVGASGTGTSRIVKEFSDGDAIASWERIEGTLVNQSATSDSTQIAQAGADALAQNSEQTSLSFTPIERNDLMFGVHYNVGDYVTVQLEPTVPTPYANQGQVVDLVRQATINLVKDGPQTVVPTMGTPARGTVAKLIRAFQDHALRLNMIERQ